MTGTKKVIKRSPGTGGKMYFDASAQTAIEKFQLTTDRKEAEQIYLTKIMPAFDRLVESLIFVYGFSSPNEPIDVMKNDCISFLYETLHKFDATRNTKAFSYFNVVARNWLIIASKNRQKKLKRFVSLEDLKNFDTLDSELYRNNQANPTPEEQLENNDQRDSIMKVLKKIKQQVSQPHEHACMDAIITVFDQIDDLDFLNKRAVFVYVKNISNLNQKQMSVAMSVIRRHYRNILKQNGGVMK
jgi:hypothetical protein